MRRPTALADLPTLIKRGESAFISGGVTPPVPFIDALQATPDASRDLHMTTSLAPGIDNPFDFERLHSTARVTGLFMQESLREAQRQGRYRALPMSYGGFLRHLQSQTFDLGVIQVSPPDAEGRCSLGPSVEFTPVALGRCRRVLALVNPRLPTLKFSVSLPLSRFDHHCEIDLPVPEYVVDVDETTRVIAGHIAALIADGCTLQMGVGKVPTALAERLRDRRRLRIHSGLVSDGFANLMESGALDADYVHTACVASGTEGFYRWLPDARGLRIAGCEITHGALTLAALQRFVAVNSALEVDLFGQCNLEHAQGRAVSGAGGAPDFARAARLCAGGLSIVALNASYRNGMASRIVPALSAGAVVSLSRVDVDLVVTEFGIADLRHASVHERALALIGIAAPDFRNDLERAWSKLTATL